MDRTAELDLFQPSTLYWKAVPVFLRRAEKDERPRDLTIRIIAGLQRANHAQRVSWRSWRPSLSHWQPRPFNSSPRPTCLQVLRVYVSSEADLFFLYVLEVNEDDFAALKLDQGILVRRGGAWRASAAAAAALTAALSVSEAAGRAAPQVDFANFPGKVIGLLEKCIACRGEDLPRCVSHAVLQRALF